MAQISEAKQAQQAALRAVQTQSYRGRWQDSNGHIFTVENVELSGRDDRFTITLHGTSGNCEKFPICNRDHDGPYSQDVDPLDGTANWFFGWHRLSA